jgi:hypothetical protein
VRKLGDVVILSFVRCNDQGTVGFVKDFQRLNVALTRARHLLIAVGCAVTLGGPVLGPGQRLGPRPGLSGPLSSSSKNKVEEGEIGESQIKINCDTVTIESRNIDIDNELNKKHSKYNFHLKMIIDDVRQRNKIFIESDIFGSGNNVNRNYSAYDCSRNDSNSSSSSSVIDIYNRNNKNDDNRLTVNSRYNINDNDNKNSNNDKNYSDDNNQNSSHYISNNNEKDYEKKLKIRLEELKSILRKDTPPELPEREQQVYI